VITHKGLSNVLEALSELKRLCQKHFVSDIITREIIFNGGYFSRRF